MHTLRNEHQISDFDSWKAAFDRDPVGREQSGLRRHRVFRPIDDQNYVMIDLDFESSSEAEAFLAALRRDVWGSRQAQCQPWSATRRHGSSRLWRARSTEQGVQTPALFTQRRGWGIPRSPYPDSWMRGARIVGAPGKSPQHRPGLQAPCYTIG